MAYGLKYQGDFDNIVDVNYMLQIFKKNYSGGAYGLQLAGVPVVQSWETDEIRVPVKGCNLKMKYLNNGSIPVQSFFSVNDDEFLVKFYEGTNLLFIGFLVQDDFSEPMLDYRHEVELLATDNLGLLKNIELDYNNINFLPAQTAEGDFKSLLVPTENWIYLRNTNFIPVVGATFTLSGHPIGSMNNSFVPSVVNYISPGNYDVKTATFTGDAAAAAVSINGIGSTVDFGKRISLLNFIHICLRNTGLELQTYIYANLTEVSFSLTHSFLQQAYLDGETFLTDKHDNCYSVLEKVLSKFNLSLFQSLGRWNIVRWDELRLTQAIPCFIYDKDFILQGTDTLPVFFLAGFEQLMYPETGLTKSVVRSFEYAKEKFDYNYPKYLLKNYDLLKIGALLRQYTSGPNLIKEYVAESWEDSYNTPAVERFIRVETDNLGNEIHRYLVLRNATGDSARAVQSKRIEVNKDDKLNFSFSFKTNVSQAGPLTIIFAVRVYDGTNNRYVDEIPLDNGAWQTGIGYNHSVASGENTNEWRQVSIKSSGIPFSGHLYCYLAQATQDPQSSAKETLYSDIRLEYTSFINDSTKVIGHTHKNLQNIPVKNNSDIEINIDDSPRNPIAGTLFTSVFTGILQNRTALWSRNGVIESRKLGDIITKDTLQWRSVPRLRLDGSYRGLQQAGQNISMLNWMKYEQLPGINFIFGSMEIDYRNNRVTATAIEICKDSDGESGFDYSFNYLYDTK